MISIKWHWELNDSILENSIFVIADICAATTNIATLLSEDINKLIIVNEENIDSAINKFDTPLIIGESKILPENFFCASNHPFDIEKVNVKKRNVLYMSNNGSRVIEKVFSFKPLEVLTVCFRNIEKVADYLRKIKNRNIILVASGEINLKDKIAYEDLLCLQFLKSILEGNKINEIKNKKEAADFVRNNYESKDMDGNIRIIFNSPKLSIIPICKKIEDNLIEILNRSIEMRLSSPRRRGSN